MTDTQADGREVADPVGLDQNWSSLKVGTTIAEQAEALCPADSRSHHPQLVAAIETLAEQVEADGRARAAVKAELPYHNREHVRDVLCALKLLVTYSAAHPATADQLALTLAMTGHDFGHEGAPNRFAHELETRSWQRVDAVLQSFAAAPRHRRLIRTLILKTDPQGYAQLRQRERSSDLMRLVGLAIDADLLASLLPSFGFALGTKLADEQVAAGLPHAKGFATLRGRAMFLRSAPLLSDALQNLGISRVVEAQLAVISGLDEAALTRPWSPAWGDEFLGQVTRQLDI